MKLLENIKHARRAGVPLISISTQDQQAIITRVVKEVNGNGTPIVRWDYIGGTSAVNDAGTTVLDITGEKDEDQTVKNPVTFLRLCQEFPKDTIAFFQNAQEFLLSEKPGDSPAVLQAIANLRDEFKQDGRMLVLLAPELKLPTALKNDVVQLDDPLPDAMELRQIIEALDKATTERYPDRPLMDEKALELAVEAVMGLSHFSAEQAVAMAIRKDGIDMLHLWNSKIAQVQQTPGLSIFRNDGKFDDIGGLDNLKCYLTKIMTGRKAPKLIVWIDEIGTSGVANREDLSGVNQDTEGTLLQFMQNKRVYGVMLAGVQGAGKSEICKAVGGEFGRLVIRLDLGAAKGGIVGQSEAQLRQALKVIEACGGDDILWLATANQTNKLSGAMKNRYSETFFFDLPNKEERVKIWSVWLKKFDLPDELFAEDDGWNGRNIYQACEKAYRMTCSIAEASEWVTPVADTDRDGIEELRVAADGRCLSASKPGLYWRSREKREVKTAGTRKVGV